MFGTLYPMILEACCQKSIISDTNCSYTFACYPIIPLCELRFVAEDTQIKSRADNPRQNLARQLRVLQENELKTPKAAAVSTAAETSSGGWYIGG